MSETKEPDDKKSLSLASPPRRLELKKTVETGQVRQSFSHGRSKAVTVEVRKKRAFGPGAQRFADSLAPAGAEAGVSAPQPHAPAPPKATAAPAPAPAPAALRTSRGKVVLKQLTEDEKAARARALGESRKADAEARRLAEEDARRRAIEDARQAAEREAASRRAAEEETRKRQEEESRRKAEDEATRRLATEAQPAAPQQEAAGAPAAATAAEEDDSRKKRPGAKVAAPKPASTKAKVDQRRRSGKLTISKALDEDERVRSLASFRRARERERRLAMGLSKEAPKKVIREVVVPETITVQELAARMAERGVDVIKSLMRMGVMATINQVIDADTADLIVQEFGHRPKRVSEADVEMGLVGAADEEANLKSRPPVVTIMGHVDHGKTSLLDALRETDVASREAGGITQHIGAYQVTLPTGARITFLDTPGHEAFTAMRARGAKVTDIVILVVAADDSVMPQTVEAIRHAKAAGVPMVVAINKCDKPDANPERVRQQLLQHEVVVEELGGDVLSVEVSAKTRTGLDRLVEAVLLQAELLDLSANPDRSAEGVIVEAKLDRGRGPVATVLVQRGTLKVGDVLVAGSEWGRVRALVDERGQPLQEAGPAMPVEVLGLQATPEAGDEFSVVESESRAREVSDFRHRRQREARAVAGARGTLEQMFSKIKSGEVKEVAAVIKADVQGSLEAILGAAAKLATEEVALRVLHGAVGSINESDVTLARASGGIIIGFNVRANKQARDLANRDGVDIRYYSVIYDVIDDIRTMLTGLLAPSLRERFLGNAEIREVFSITKVGKVAGCLVTDGLVRRGAKVRLLRDHVVIHEGTLSTLKRFKDEVREVKQGTECGMAFENYQDIQVGDVIECFDVEQVARQL